MATKLIKKSAKLIKLKSKKKKKKKKNKEGEGGGGGSQHVCTFALKKKNAQIFKMKFYSYSPVFPIDYNGSKKY